MPKFIISYWVKYSSTITIEAENVDEAEASFAKNALLQTRPNPLFENALARDKNPEILSYQTEETPDGSEESGDPHS